MERMLRDPWYLLFLGVFMVGAFVFTMIVRAVKGDGGSCWKRALEAAILSFVGGFLSRLLISCLLAGADDSPAAVVAVGWGFFLWPGAINTIPWLMGKDLVISVESHLYLAMAVGCLTGMMDGLWRTRDWTDVKGSGVLGFLMDVTWGLAGATNGCLLHGVNVFGLVWSDHSDDDRQGAHRYRSGFAMKSGYAFTQGEVMSNMSGHSPGSDLYNHEKLHVWQNRLAGPLFTLTYLGWMAVMFIPSLIAGAAIQGATVGETIFWWCYMDNPWEVWAYEANNPSSRRHSLSKIRWSIGVVWGVAVPFYLAVLAGVVAMVACVWF
jgi:hypothetical protein